MQSLENARAGSVSPARIPSRGTNTNAAKDGKMQTAPTTFPDATKPLRHDDAVVLEPPGSRSQPAQIDSAQPDEQEDAPTHTGDAADTVLEREKAKSRTGALPAEERAEISVNLAANKFSPDRSLASPGNTSPGNMQPADSLPSSPPPPPSPAASPTVRHLSTFWLSRHSADMIWLLGVQEAERRAMMERDRSLVDELVQPIPQPASAQCKRNDSHFLVLVCREFQLTIAGICRDSVADDIHMVRREAPPPFGDESQLDCFFGFVQENGQLPREGTSQRLSALFEAGRAADRTAELPGKCLVLECSGLQGHSGYEGREKGRV